MPIRFMQAEPDIAGASPREGVFHGIREEFIHDEPAWHGFVDIQPHVHIDGKRNPFRVCGIRLEQDLRQAPDIVAEVDVGKIA